MGSGFSGMLNQLTFGLFKNSATEKGDDNKSAANEELTSNPTIAVERLEDTNGDDSKPDKEMYELTKEVFPSAI